MGDDAWALFGSDDDEDEEDCNGATAAAEAPGDGHLPRACNHPFFSSARFAWCPPAALETLDLPRRVPPCAAALRGFGCGGVAVALEHMARQPTEDAASEVIALAVSALVGSAKNGERT